MGFLGLYQQEFGSIGRDLAEKKISEREALTRLLEALGKLVMNLPEEVNSIVKERERSDRMRS